MRRVLKLKGHADTRSSVPRFDLPDGEYRIETADGNMILIHVGHGPAGSGVTIRAPYQALTLNDGARAPYETRDEIAITHYPLLDSYSQAFRAWCANPNEIAYPGPRDEWEEATR